MNAVYVLAMAQGARAMSTTRKLLGGTRALIGAAGWIAPDATARAFGIDPAATSRFIGRLFASREFALALATLTASPERLPTVATVGAIIDSADALAGIDERRRGGLSTYSFVSGAVGAMVFAAMGAVVARDAQRALRGASAG